MPSLTINHKFLLDENVHRKLFTYIKESGYEVRLVPKSATDTQIAKISKKEDLILITNDEDFIEYTKEEVFSIIWLRITQGDVDTLINSFKKLVIKQHTFSCRLIILKNDTWDNFPLPEKNKIEKRKI